MRTLFGSPATASRGDVEQIAADFGVHPMTLSKWLRQADIEDGVKPGRDRRRVGRAAGAASPESGCWSRRTRSCAGRRRICPRPTCREKALPARERARRRRDPRRGDVPGTQARPPALLPLAGQPGHRRRAGRGPSGQRPLRRPPRRPGVRLPVPGRRGPTTPGEPMAERTAWRICSRQRLVVGVRQEQARQERQGRPTGPRRPGRAATSPPTPRTSCGSADITEHRTAEGKLYLCAIKDVFSNRIVGYSIDSRMKSRLAVHALDNAVARRGDVAGCILHTDRGIAISQPKIRQALGRHDMVGSMGRVGAAGDNAAMESSSACCRRTCSTAAAGTPASSYASPSSPGSNAPTTDAAARAPSAD